LISSVLAKPPLKSVIIIEQINISTTILVDKRNSVNYMRG
jgi:hypothetical protein